MCGGVCNRERSVVVFNSGGFSKTVRLHNCGNTTEATTLLQQFFKKKKEKKNAPKNKLRYEEKRNTVGKRWGWGWGVEVEERCVVMYEIFFICALTAVIKVTKHERGFGSSYKLFFHLPVVKKTFCVGLFPPHTLAPIHARFLQNLQKTDSGAQLWQHNRGNYTTPTIYQLNFK